MFNRYCFRSDNHHPGPHCINPSTSQCNHHPGPHCINPSTSQCNHHPGPHCINPSTSQRNHHPGPHCINPSTSQRNHHPGPHCINPSTSQCNHYRRLCSPDCRCNALSWSGVNHRKPCRVHSSTFCRSKHKKAHSDSAHHHRRDRPRLWQHDHLSSVYRSDGRIHQRPSIPFRCDHVSWGPVSSSVPHHRQALELQRSERDGLCPLLPGDVSQRSFTRSTTCLPCPPGHYANESGAAVCRACEKGYFSSKQNAAFCVPCLPGSFCNTTACTACLPCPGGQESLQEGSEECVPCLPGMFKGPSDNKCKLCRTGEYQLQRGKESCDLCPENHYCPNPDVNPVKCPPDAFCPAGSAEPAYCMEAFLYKAGDSCQLTPLMVILLAIFSAGGILAVFLIILRRRQEYSKKSLKSLLLPRGSGRHTTYGGTEHTEPVYAGW
ncbi:uncharacterized protein ACIBXB_008981 isoform 4-T4 [Morphnus guianensis]